jgi:hypothetical protein
VALIIVTVGGLPWVTIRGLPWVVMRGVPWLWYFMLARIRELREAIYGK